MERIFKWYEGLSHWSRIPLTIAAILTALFAVITFLILFCVAAFALMGWWCLLGIPVFIGVVIISCFISFGIKEDKNG